jgi:hypothetical protein
MHGNEGGEGGKEDLKRAITKRPYKGQCEEPLPPFWFLCLYIWVSLSLTAYPCYMLKMQAAGSSEISRRPQP